MAEATKKAENQPGSIPRGTRATTPGRISDWADLFPGSEELPSEEEYEVESPEAVPSVDWEPEPEHEPDAERAGADLLDLAREGVTVADEAPRFEDEAKEADGEPAEQVWATTPDRVPFFEHALYVEAMHALAAGKGVVAAAYLTELAELYPEEPAIRDLLLRMELKTAVTLQRDPPAARGQATPVLQSALTLLLLLTIGLAAIAGFYLAYTNIVEPASVNSRAAAEIQSLEAEIDVRIQAGDWNGAREKLLALQALEPGKQGISEELAYVDRQKQLSIWYADALATEQTGDTGAALAYLQQIEAQEAGYRDVPLRIQRLQTLQVLEGDWLEAESRVQAEEWQDAIALLLDIRRRDPEYRAEQVKERLFQIYERLARQSLNQADGNAERLREALAYLDAALGERPTNRELARERTLALGYVSGSDAQARGDWLEATEQWEAVYARQPGYQDGVLEARLQEAYPQAARQAIAVADGSVERLEQALTYIGLALRNSPEDEGLRQDRELVSAYLAGARAFAAGFWNQAIRYWGPLYAVQPGYQSGVLESNLRQACGASPDPDLGLCPP